MIYKFICETDKLILITSSTIISLTSFLLPIDKWLCIVCSSFIICWGGWEYWWTMGISPNSLDYHQRARLLQFTEVTYDMVLHSLILAISDIAISLYIFSVTTYIYPDGLYHFHLNYIGMILLLGIAQNKLITLSGISPITNNMSWAPLVHNSNCSNSLSCWKNQQEWFYAILILYPIVLLI